MVSRESKANEIEVADGLILKEDGFNSESKSFSKDEERKSNES